MQYPIIDALTQAYINNGWTGLEFNGMNMWDEHVVLGSFDTTTGQLLPSQTQICTAEMINVVPNTSYRMITTDNSTGGVWLFFYNEDRQLITNYEPPAETYRVNNAFRYDDNTIVITPSNCYYIKWYFQVSYGTVYRNDTSLNYPSTYTNYISTEETENNINTFKNDISNRLKLPLPHYFPHPVIDALQRAAAGTQTADDTEILRHYLTPLGIGGI